MSFTIIYYYIPEDCDDLDIPNAFGISKPADEIKYDDIVKNFPQDGHYHFRFKYKHNSHTVWLDLKSKDVALPKFENNIFIKVTRKSWGSETSQAPLTQEPAKATVKRAPKVESPQNIPNLLDNSPQQSDLKPPNPIPAQGHTGPARAQGNMGPALGNNMGYMNTGMGNGMGMGAMGNGMGNMNNSMGNGMGMGGMNNSMGNMNNSMGMSNGLDIGLGGGQSKNQSGYVGNGVKRNNDYKAPDLLFDFQGERQLLTANKQIFGREG